MICVSLRNLLLVLPMLSLMSAAPDAFAQYLPGEGPRLVTEFSHEDIAGGTVSLDLIRRQGMTVFTTPFNKHDGFGDGRMNPKDPTSPGGRPSLQGNGTFLRVNGLDGQTCLECHSVTSNASIPARLGVGGVGPAVTNAMFQPRTIDVSDADGAGIASYDGRFINPPFLFGSGGVELLGKEMTAELQALKAEAEANPGVDVPLTSKGVSFGTIRFVDGEFDTSEVEGIDHDLVVRPFGRKGEFPSVRSFDVGAMEFHFGMQTVEAVGADVDADADGVVNELLIGENSSLSIFLTTLERPVQPELTAEIAAGADLFETIGCSDCHKPFLTTDSSVLTYSFPEVPEDPSANVYFEVDLAKAPSGFDQTPGGGLRVPLFADLKRHNMGDDLAETFLGTTDDWFFTTARLWGLADTAPYMHDGRALTIGDAILMHAGEAETQRAAYESLSFEDKTNLHHFLLSLRTPIDPAADLQNLPSVFDSDADGDVDLSDFAQFQIAFTGPGSGN
jgi:hypothetical protein